MWYPAQRKPLYDLQEEVIHLSSVAKQLLVFPKRHVLNPREGIVEEGPAAHCQLHVLTKYFNHVLEIAVIVRETLSKDDQVGDVGHSIGYKVFGVKGLSLVLVDGVNKKHALFCDLPLKKPLAAAKVSERVGGQFTVFDPAFTVFTIEETFGCKTNQIVVFIQVLMH